MTVGSCGSAAAELIPVRSNPYPPASLRARLIAALTPFFARRARTSAFALPSPSELHQLFECAGGVGGFALPRTKQASDPPFLRLRPLDVQELRIRSEAGLDQEILETTDVSRVRCTLLCRGDNEEQDGSAFLIVGQKLLVPGELMMGERFLLERARGSADITPGSGLSQRGSRRHSNHVAWPGYRSPPRIDGHSRRLWFSRLCPDIRALHAGPRFRTR